ncbi:MAG: hypothetical protein EAX91_08210 [Candidatus Lokiarchaeota archaeon]|nr:hypothetical protein [Candidatus Lokiarchaeota archaeon]
MKEKNARRNICNLDESACSDCTVNGKLMCTFNIKDTVYFILPVLGVWVTLVLGLAFGFIIGKIDFPLLIIFSIAYIGFLIFFFQVWENKILCSHCPYYAFEDEKSLKCYANYGLYKAWKYNPAPMTVSERVQFIIGITLFAGIPLALFLFVGLYIYFAVSLIFTVVWLISMHFLSCSKCPNFSCPLNNVSKEVIDEYLKQNSIMRKAWEENSYKID